MKKYEKTKDNEYICTSSMVNMLGMIIHKGQVFHFEWNSKDGNYELIEYGGLGIGHQCFIEHFGKVN